MSHAPKGTARAEVAGPIERVGEFVDRLAIEYPGVAIFAVVECPTWNGKGTKEVRVAAVTWERALKSRFRKRTHKRVDPRVWQRSILEGCPGFPKDTKRASTWYASTMLHCAAASEDHDLADALCILEHAKRLAREHVAREAGRRQAAADQKARAKAAKSAAKPIEGRRNGKA